MIEPPGRLRWRLPVATALIAAVVLGPARPAFAHVDLVDSAPADGTVVTEPIDTITLTFSTSATLANDGVVVYDSTATRIPADVQVLSETEIVVTPTTPLGDGSWAVTWSMQAPDAHPTTGGFEFTVRTPAVAATAGPNPVETGPSAVPAPSAEQPSILAEVLPADPWLAQWLSTIARLLSFGGALIGIGSLVFAMAVFEGSRAEARLIGFWVRRAGVAVAASVPFEVMATSFGLAGGNILGTLAPSNLASAAGGAFGFALAFRLLGGIAITAGTRLVIVSRPEAPAELAGGDVLVRARERLHVAASPAALVGAGILAVSFLFDGHTVTAAPAALVRFAALVHVVGGAVWVAGVCLLARLLLARHSRGEELDTARLVIPFSTIAGVSVAMIGIAGGALALSIADGFGTFFTTAWGRVLIAKMVIAGIAGAIGGYNHLRVVPMLRADPHGPMGAAAIRRTIRIEAALLILVVVVTAYFVGLSAVT